MKAKAQNDLFSPEFHLPRENSEGKQIIKIEIVGVLKNAIENAESQYQRKRDIKPGDQ